jgi:hypothetical protein
MRVDVVESLATEAAATDPPSVDEASTERALRTFFAAIESDDSLFVCEPAVVKAGGAASDRYCRGDFVLRFRSGTLASGRKFHFLLLEKLVELLKAAGSADWLAAQLCLAPDAGGDSGSAGLVLRVRLAARGNSTEQSALRWGLGVAHVQQALLFTSRYLRQQIGHSGD